VKNKLKSIRQNSAVLPVLALVAGVAGNASAVAPIDMADVGTELAGYVGGAATAGLVLFAAIFGVRIILKAFKTGAH